MTDTTALLDRPEPTPAEPFPAAVRHRTLVVIPTYNEARTIGAVLARVRAVLPDADILVVDDGSPDGTAWLVEHAAGKLGGILLLQRSAKQGLGAAYRAGFELGIRRGYGVLVEMDADLQHDPLALPDLVAAVERGADLAIGSRYVEGGTIPQWEAPRRVLSRWGNRYAAAVLGLHVRDLTSGYRAYRADALRAAHAETTRATGYAFQIELAYRVARAGGWIQEVPIEFGMRAAGDSKMSWWITVEALARVTAWGVRDRLRDVLRSRRSR